MPVSTSTLKIIYLFSFLDRAILNERILNYFKNAPGFQIGMIHLHDKPSALTEFCNAHHIPNWSIRYSGYKDLLRAVWKIYGIFKKEKPHIINANLMDASLAGLPAAWLARVPVRILSRHHSSLHHVYHPHFVKVDRMLSMLATHIVVPSESMKSLMEEKEGVKEGKIKVIHHGLPLDDFANVDADRVKKLEQKYFNGPKPFPVVGVISRFMHWKGVQYIIPAFKKLREIYPHAHLLLANAQGPYKNELLQLLHTLPEHSYTIISFEPDSPALYKLMDLFVHTPIDDHSEAFGQIYVEALASGIPSVFTLSGIACDFIRNNENAIVVSYKNENEIYEGMTRLLADPELCKRLVENGKRDVNEFFRSEYMLDNLNRYFRSLYLSPA